MCSTLEEPTSVIEQVKRVKKRLQSKVVTLKSGGQAGPSKKSPIRHSTHCKSMKINAN